MIEAFLTCLALNVYYEARSEPMVGQYAVAHVVLNRVANESFPDDACKVVKQGYSKGLGKCQFSWYCDGQKDVIWANYESTGETIEGNARAGRESVELAIMIAGNTALQIKDNTRGATFYYAHNLVYPHWADSKQYIGVLGNHTFMK